MTSPTRRWICSGRHTAHAQAVADVGLHRHLREQRVVLEDHADRALLDGPGGDVFAVEGDAPAAVGVHQAGDDAQQRGLAAARGPSSASTSPGSTVSVVGRRACAPPG
jgi:hypothetical protein